MKIDKNVIVVILSFIALYFVIAYKDLVIGG